MTDEPMLVAEALEGGLERLTMNRPARLNALNHPMAEALLAHFESRRRDEATRVILLCGAGRAFCSGADLKAGGQPDALRDGPKGDWVLRDLMKAMRACPQPVIITAIRASGSTTSSAAKKSVLPPLRQARKPAACKPGWRTVSQPSPQCSSGVRLMRTRSPSRRMLPSSR